jgi:polyhydroxybutyrate depolymerase
MRRRRVLFAFVPAFLLIACTSGGGVRSSSGGTAGAGAGGSSGAGGADAGPIGGDRPVQIHVPSSYQPGTPVPLVMMLHGYSATGQLEEAYLGITHQSDLHGFIYAMPNGTVDKTGLQFWNATDACCDLYGTGVDDSTYLSNVISEIEARYTIDPKRVYLVGHSNGGFMSYRMACDHADQVVALVSLAGAMWEDVSLCKPSAPVSTLEIHGTADTVIAYDGGTNAGHTYPSAPTTVSDWVTFDGCSATPDTTSPPLDLDSSLPGDETTVTKYGSCKAGGHAELWTINGGAHVPLLSTAFTPDVIQFLYDHPRP